MPSEMSEHKRLVRALTEQGVVPAPCERVVGGFYRRPDGSQFGLSAMRRAQAATPVAIFKYDMEVEGTMPDKRKKQPAAGGLLFPLT